MKHSCLRIWKFWFFFDSLNISPSVFFIEFMNFLLETQDRCILNAQRYEGRLFLDDFSARNSKKKCQNLRTFSGWNRNNGAQLSLKKKKNSSAGIVVPKKKSTPLNRPCSFFLYFYFIFMVYGLLARPCINFKQLWFSVCLLRKLNFFVTRFRLCRCTP